MLPRPTRHSTETGQVLAIFALALVAIVAMTGLVLDGGSAMVQRRDQQNVSDAAAMAGAYAWLNSGLESAAAPAAQANAASNGYGNGTNGVVVSVQTGTAANGASSVTVTVSKPHRNSFAGIVGMSSWNVSAKATAITGAPNAAVGAMPIIFNKKAFPNGQGPSSEQGFDLPGGGNEDVPQTASQFNWTIYCLANGNPCNANSNGVRELIENENLRDQEVHLGMDIGPLNSGNHTTLFSSLAAHVGTEFPVSIVDDDGDMVGWAMFHLTGSVGGSTKQIRGYFVSPVNFQGIYIAVGGGQGSSQYGAYVVKLYD